MRLPIPLVISFLAVVGPNLMHGAEDARQETSSIPVAGQESARAEQSSDTGNEKRRPSLSPFELIKLVRCSDLYKELYGDSSKGFLRSYGVGIAAILGGAFTMLKQAWSSSSADSAVDAKLESKGIYSSADSAADAKADVWRRLSIGSFGLTLSAFGLAMLAFAKFRKASDLAPSYYGPRVIKMFGGLTELKSSVEKYVHRKDT